MPRVSALATIVAVSFAGAPAGAGASPRDVASTHTYILAGYALAKAGVASIRPAEANVRRAIHAFGRRCPNAGAGSPQNDESQHMSLEVAGALWSTAYGTAIRPIRAFVRAVGPLRWSTPRLTRIAHAYARSLYELATLPMPDLCGDIAAWRASGYNTIPLSTLRFDEHLEAIHGHTIPWRLLARYEQAGDRGLVARIARMETTIENTETSVGFEDWNALLETLDVQQ
jgi:hypothetical protein